MVLTDRINHIRFPIDDESYVGTVRRAVREMGRRCGFGSEPLERLSLVTTEAATNLAKHADRGEILLSPQKNAAGRSIEVVSVDRGPGIENPEALCEDGVSTSGTLGFGLGAMKRQADCFAISSCPEKGTSIVMRVFADRKRECDGQSGGFRLGVVSTPHPGEVDSGDSVGVAFADRRAAVLVVDALGHGPEAALSADRALELFEESPLGSPVRLVERIHAALLSMRGAALALALIDPAAGELEYVGVGNITARIHSGLESTGCYSSLGTVGGELGSLRTHIYKWIENSVLCLYSDGIRSQATLKNMEQKMPSLMAACLYRDYCRTTDDTTVAVVGNSQVLWS